MSTKPRILLVTPHFPLGERYGAQLRTLNVARILSGFSELGVVVFPFGPPSDGVLSATRSEFDLRQVFWFTKPGCGSLFSTLRREIDPYFTDTEGKRLSVSDEDEFMAIAGEYDLIWFMGIAIPNCLGRTRFRNAVLDVDDVPSQVWKGRFRERKGIAGKVKALRKIVQWKWRETVFGKRFNVVCVCSDEDRNYLGGGDVIHVLPNGFETPAFHGETARPSPPRVGFIGTFRYEPNVEAVDWFVREVWPLVIAEIPEARLRLVGSGSGNSHGDDTLNIDALGFVEDSEAEIATWTQMVVPIRRGGGTRIKIAEAFGRGCPVVSTALGAYGYEIENGRECFIADSAREFAGCCIRLIRNPDEGSAMASRARAKFDKELSWEAIGPVIRKVVERSLPAGSIVHPAADLFMGGEGMVTKA